MPRATISIPQQRIWSNPTFLAVFDQLWLDAAPRTATIIAMSAADAQILAALRAALAAMNIDGQAAETLLSASAGIFNESPDLATLQARLSLLTDAMRKLLGK